MGRGKRDGSASIKPKGSSAGQTMGTHARTHETKRFPVPTSGVSLSLPPYLLAPRAPLGPICGTMISRLSKKAKKKHKRKSKCFDLSPQVGCAPVWDMWCHLYLEGGAGPALQLAPLAFGAGRRSCPGLQLLESW